MCEWAPSRCPRSWKLLLLSVDLSADFSLTKYTTAGQALAVVLKKLIPEIKAGKKVLELTTE